MKKTNASNWLWSFAANSGAVNLIWSTKILFNVDIIVKELKEGEKPPFINKCTMSATQGVEIELPDTDVWEQHSNRKE